VGQAAGGPERREILGGREKISSAK